MICLDDEAQAAVQPMPAEWGPDVHDLGPKRGGALRWEGRVQLNGQAVALEVGLRPRTPADRARDLEELRRTSWTLTELARLGRADLLGPFRKDRHDPGRRPVSVPTLPAPAAKA